MTTIALVSYSSPLESGKACHLGRQGTDPWRSYPPCKNSSFCEAAMAGEHTGQQRRGLQMPHWQLVFKSPPPRHQACEWELQIALAFQSSQLRPQTEKKSICVAPISHSWPTESVSITKWSLFYAPKSGAIIPTMVP